MAMESPANGPAVAVTEAATVAAPGGVAATSEENVPTALAIDENHADVEAVAATESDLAADGAAAAATTTAAAPTRRHRVKVAAMDAVEGKIAPRVEKLRQASTVMLDEAADDPGLRFVLIAAVLIIFSLVLVLLNQILK
jgi:poly-gamma-glutamate capsule biosynthesis protein CapA/YwtB (metallophosphatase superfamily)